MVVREDSLTVFGFRDDDEKSMFELVQTASGVGPKVAQAITAVLTPDDLRRAIAGDDVKTLTRVPGIGQKGAQRIILELKDRIGPPSGPAASRRTDCAGSRGAARCSRDWSVSAGRRRDAEKAVEAVSDQAGDAPDVGALLRSALRSLSKA